MFIIHWVTTPDLFFVVKEHKRQALSADVSLTEGNPSGSKAGSPIH
jgi:hypothetical protein